MGDLAAKIPLVGDDLAAMLQKRAENMLLESDKEGPLAWMIKLLREYGVCASSHLKRRMTASINSLLMDWICMKSSHPTPQRPSSAI